ncbi:unnamed protein product [Soboliphyme baturini]|uniref:SOCS box domain-containing protein n=1 Tax=Soboliphyme baturini TaxID=241478 RepID=A0A183IVN8_9BILA|nr:unnamed protein product [Soboliphyme baturini]
MALRKLPAAINMHRKRVINILEENPNIVDCFRKCPKHEESSESDDEEPKPFNPKRRLRGYCRLVDTLPNDFSEINTDPSDATAPDSVTSVITADSINRFSREPNMTFRQHCYDAIMRSGSTGVSLNELCRSGFMERSYISSNTQDQVNAYLDTLQARTGIDFRKCAQIEKIQMSDRMCKRILMILDCLEETAVWKRYDLLETACESYGTQNSRVRLQLLHEFLFHLIYRAPQSDSFCGDNSSDDAADPPVYVDKISWQRFIPLLEPNKGLAVGWFTIDQIIPFLPLSVCCQIYRMAYREFLNDSIRKHTLLKHLPTLINQAIVFDHRLQQSLTSLCDMMCHLGLLSLGPPSPSTSNSPVERFYFLHKGSTLTDTSPAPRSFRLVAEPLNRYKIYQYKFESSDDVRLYWVHMRAIVCSTRIGLRSCQKESDGMGGLGGGFNCFLYCFY